MYTPKPKKLLQVSLNGSGFGDGVDKWIKSRVPFPAELTPEEALTLAHLGNKMLCSIRNIDILFSWSLKPAKKSFVSAILIHLASIIN